MSGLKFQVNNREKMRDGNMAKDLVTQHWETLKDAIYKIHSKQASILSYEELYRTAYNLVLHKHGEMLYNNVKTTTAELMKPMADEILSKADDELIKCLNKLWADQKLCIIMIKDILLYMNKNYVPKVKLKPVEQMQTS
jgi:cullin 3